MLGIPRLHRRAGRNLLLAAALGPATAPAAARAGSGYYLQAFLGEQALSGTQVCTDPANQSCNFSPAWDASYYYASVAVDCHGGEGFLGVIYGIQIEETSLLHVSITPAPGFLGEPPTYDYIGMFSTTGCAPCCTVVAHHAFLRVGAGGVTTITLGPSGGLGEISIVTCDERQIPGVCGASGTFGPEPGSVCQCGGPTPTTGLTWGAIRGLFE